METTSINNGGGVIPPAVIFGLSPEAVDRLGVAEARSIIRDSGIGPKIGLKGTQLVGLNLADCKSVIITGINPIKAGAVTGNTGEALATLIREIAGNSEKIKAELIDYVDQELAIIRADRVKSIPRDINVISPSGAVTVSGAQHRLFPTVLKMLACPGVNIALVGPASSGKSKIGEIAADALGLDYRTMSFNILSSKSDILSFTDANGHIQASAFEQIFTGGGLFVADEFDSCHAGIATILNAAIANRISTFTGGRTLKAHPNFRFLCCMNTYGTGPSAQYVGRNRLDAATLDRFAFLYVDIDEELESAILGLPYNFVDIDISAGGVPTTAEWLKTVRTFRRAVVAENMPIIISMRASIMGADLASVGFGIDMLIEMLIFRGISQTDRDRLTRAVLNIRGA